MHSILHHDFTTTTKYLLLLSIIERKLPCYSHVKISQSTMLSAYLPLVGKVDNMHTFSHLPQFKLQLFFPSAIKIRKSGVSDFLHCLKNFQLEEGPISM